MACGVQATPPEKELPLSVTSTGCVYHPLKSAGRESLIETVGLLASYWKLGLLPPTLFPALSVQVPVTVAFLVSGPE